MDRKIRVAPVDYLNTKPLIYGFERGGMKNEVELLPDYPAKVAAKLLNDEVDIGLVPVATLPGYKEYYIISDYCIGADGEVASVCLFSDVPMEEIKTVVLDYQSRTSVALFKILLKEHWKISPELITGTPGYEKEISGTTAGLVIGDRALKQRLHSKYIYDLATGWKELTGLPFVFAAWVANKKLPQSFIDEFNKTTAMGFSNLDEIITANPFPEYDLKEYYTVNIDYRLDKEKRKALDLFLNKLLSYQ